MALRAPTNFIAIKKQKIAEISSSLKAAFPERVRLAVAVSKEGDSHKKYQSQIDLLTGKTILETKTIGQFFFKNKSITSVDRTFEIAIYAYLVPSADQALPEGVGSDTDSLIAGYGEHIQRVKLADKEVNQKLRGFFDNSLSTEIVLDKFFETLATLHILGNIVRDHAPMQAPYNVRKDLFERAEDNFNLKNVVKPTVTQFTQGDLDHLMVSSLLTDRGKKQLYQFIPSINTLSSGFVIDYTYLISDPRIAATPGKIDPDQSCLLTISVTQQPMPDESDELVYSFSHKVRLVNVKLTSLSEAFRTGKISQVVQLVSRGRLLSTEAISGQNARFVDGVPDDMGVFGELLNAFNMALPTDDQEKFLKHLSNAEALKGFLSTRKTLMIEYSFVGDDPDTKYIYFICQVSDKPGQERYILNALPATKKQRTQNNVKASAATNHLITTYFQHSISAVANDTYRAMDCDCTIRKRASINMVKAVVTDDTGVVPKETSCARLSNRVNTSPDSFILGFDYAYPTIAHLPEQFNTDSGLSGLRYGFTKALGMVNNRVSQFVSNNPRDSEKQQNYKFESAAKQLAKKVGHVKGLIKYLEDPKSAQGAGHNAVAQGINQKSIFVFIDKPKAEKENVQGNVSVRVASYEQLMSTNGCVKFDTFPENQEGLSTLFKGDGLLAPEVDAILRLRETSEESGESLKPMLFVYFDGTQNQWSKARSLYQDIQNFWPGQQPESFINIGFLTKDTPLTVFNPQLNFSDKNDTYFEYRLPSNPEAVYIKFDYKTNTRFLAKPYRLTKLGHSPRMLDLLSQGLAATALRQAVIENDYLPLRDHGIIHMIDNCTDIITSLARLDQKSGQDLVNALCADARLTKFSAGIKSIQGDDPLDTLARQLIAIIYLDLLSSDAPGLAAITGDLLEPLKIHLTDPYGSNLFSTSMQRYAGFNQGYVPMSVVM